MAVISASAVARVYGGSFQNSILKANTKKAEEAKRAPDSPKKTEPQKVAQTAQVPVVESASSSDEVSLVDGAGSTTGDAASRVNSLVDAYAKIMSEIPRADASGTKGLAINRQSMVAYYSQSEEHVSRLANLVQGMAA